MSMHRWWGWVGALVLIAEATRADVREAVEAMYPTETLRGLWRGYQEDPQSIVTFYDTLEQKHLVERHPEETDTAVVTYFARGGEHTDYLLQSGGPDFYGLRFRRIGDSPIFFAQQSIPSDAWFSYGVNRFNRNPVDGAPGLYRESVEHTIDGAIVGPDAPLSSAVTARSEVTKGRLEALTINSAFLNESRALHLYLPAGYDPEKRYPLLIQLDGERFIASPDAAQPWQAWTPLPTILDNLRAQGSMPPTVAVLVPNQGDRSTRLLEDAFADFLAVELIPWLERKLDSAAFSTVVVSGPSRAAFTALRTGLKHADVVDAVLAQSGSFYYTLDKRNNWPVYPAHEGWLLEHIKSLPTMPLDVYLDVGLYDLGLGRVGTSRQLRDILRLKGYEVDYREYNGGHSHLNWRHTIEHGLTALLSTTESATIEEPADN